MCQPYFGRPAARSHAAVIRDEIRHTENTLGAPLTAEQRRNFSRRRWQELKEAEQLRLSDLEQRVARLESKSHE